MGAVAGDRTTAVNSEPHFTLRWHAPVSEVRPRCRTTNGLACPSVVEERQTPAGEQQDQVCYVRCDGPSNSHLYIAHGANSKKLLRIHYGWNVRHCQRTSHNPGAFQTLQPGHQMFCPPPSKTSPTYIAQFNQRHCRVTNIVIEDTTRQRVACQEVSSRQLVSRARQLVQELPPATKENKIAPARKTSDKIYGPDHQGRACSSQ